MTATTTADLDRLRAQIGSLIRAFNDHDPDGILSHFTEDVHWEDPSLPEAAVGSRAARAAVENLLHAFPDQQFDIDTLQILLDPEGRYGTSVWSWTGTMTGPIDPPGYAPTGKQAHMTGACFYEFRDGRIARHVVLYDMLGILQQLGLMPATTSAPAKMMAGAQRLGHGLRQAIHRE